MSSRDTLLARIRTALGPEIKGQNEAVDRSYRQRDEAAHEAVIAEFAERVSEYRATVREVDVTGLPTAIATACRDREVQSLVVPEDIPPAWLPAGVPVLYDTSQMRLSPEQLDQSGAVLTGCAIGIAQTGTIVLDGGPAQGRRILTLLPDFHLCVIHRHQIVGLVPEAFGPLARTVLATRRPLTFISGPSATSDIELNRVEGVHGPRTLTVFIVKDGVNE